MLRVADGRTDTKLKVQELKANAIRTFSSFGVSRLSRLDRLAVKLILYLST